MQLTLQEYVPTSILLLVQTNKHVTKIIENILILNKENIIDNGRRT